ncbi:MAG: aldo/keto reductase [Verrucomicrobia bacterium]|nr:aldo/keto reductase [Verrucomicrobiota bacterium]
MKYRILGATKLRVSVVGVGTWQFGGEWGHVYTQPEVDAVLGEAETCGINLIDTAECYGDHLSEALIGKAIREKRANWIVATKFGHHFRGHLDRTRDFTPADVQAQLDASLRALRTDYVDLYQFHSPDDAEFFRDDLWTAIQNFVRAGKVRHIGISVSPNTNIRQTDAATAAGAQAMQIIYNRLARQCEAQVLPSCQRQGLGVLARIPLASGYLSGKYKPGATFPANDVRANRKREDEDNALREVAEIAQREVPAGVPMAAWALAWCLQHPAVTCVIPGCKNPEQVRLNAMAADLPLVADDHPARVP